MFDWYRVRPFSGRIGCVYEKIAFIGNIRSNHIENTFMIANRRCENTTPDTSSVQVYLFRSCQTMTYLFPIYQVFTMKYRHSGKILKTAGYQIKIFTYTAYTRVGMKTRYHRIFITLLCLCRTRQTLIRIFSLLYCI